MENQTCRPITYPDPDGYDPEGYGLSTGVHKRLGLRRYFRPLVDQPITTAERRLAECKRESELQQMERQSHCEHSWYMLSHEERCCQFCGAVEFMPDI